MESTSSNVSLHSYSEKSAAESLKEQQQQIIDILKGQTFTIPYLSKSLPGWYMGVNPHYEKIHAEESAFLDHWVERENLREMAKKVNLSLCIACFFPRTTEAKLQVLFEKMAWFFAFDDDADNFLAADVFADQDVIPFIKYWVNPERSGPEPTVLPSCYIYRSCGPKLASGWSGTGSKEQFLKTTFEYVDYLFKVSKQRETYLPSVEQYIEERIINIGVYPTLDLIPFASPLEISAELLDHEAIQTIRYHVVRIVSLTNDLFSIRKEIKDSQFDNIIPLLMLRKGMDVQEAADYTVSLIEESYAAVNAAEKRLPELDGKAKADLDAYVDQCKDQATGSVYWHELSPRYLGKGAYGEKEILVRL
nr:sesquiterpene cyclase [Spiromastix sp.]